MARRKKASSSSVKVNFKGVESRKTPPEGDYIVEVLEAKMGESGNKNEQIEFILEIAEGEFKGVKLYLYCTLDDKSLWKLHAFLTALGVEVPEDEMELDLPDLVGEQCVGVVTHEVYNGKKRAKMTDFDSLDNYSGGDKKASGKKGASKKDEPDYDEMDEDDLRDLYLERELGTKKEAKALDEDELKEALEEADKAAAKKAGKGRSSKKDADDEDDKKGSSKKKDSGKKKAKKLDKSDVEDMDEDELQELIDEHELDVDLDDYKKLPKKVAAVVEALEEKDLLEDDD